MNFKLLALFIILSLFIFTTFVLANPDIYQRRPSAFNESAGTSLCADELNAYAYDGSYANCEVDNGNPASNYWFNTTDVIGEHDEPINNATFGVYFNCTGTDADDIWQIDYGFASTAQTCEGVSTWYPLANDTNDGCAFGVKWANNSNTTAVTWTNINNTCWRVLGDKDGSGDNMLLYIDAFHVDVDYVVDTVNLAVWDQEDDSENKPAPPGNLVEENITTNESAWFFANYSDGTNPIAMLGMNLQLEASTSWDGGDVHAEGIYAADVDDDGEIELVVSGYNGQISTWNLSSGTLTQEDINTEGGNLLFYRVSVANVDGDPALEIVTSGTDTDDWSGHVRVYNITGDQITQEYATSWDTGTTWPWGVFTADVDGDGTTEIITSGRTGANDAEIRVWNISGGNLTLETSKSWEASASTDERIWENYVGDANDDGVMEIATVGTNMDQDIGKLWIFNVTNNVITTVANTTWNLTVDEDVGVTVHIEDVDNDTRSEIIIGGYNQSFYTLELLVYNLTNSQLTLEDYYTVSLGDVAVLFGMDVADLDMDGVMEMFMVGYNQSGSNVLGRLFVFNMTNSDIRLPAEAEASWDGGDQRVFDVYIEDVDGDGAREINIAYFDNANLDGRIRVYNYTTPVCKIWFNDTAKDVMMTYNTTTKLYQYKRTFATADTYSWNTSCSKTGYTSKSSSSSTITIVTEGKIKDQIVAPCYGLIRHGDKCSVNQPENTTVNITFNYDETTVVSDTYNQTLNLVYGNSTHPINNEAGTDVPNKASCGASDEIILKNAYAETCTGFSSCVIESDKDVRLESSAPTTGYEANITFEIEACAGTQGKTYDIAPQVSLDTDGNLGADSFVQFSITVEEIWNASTGGDIYSSAATADVDNDSFMDVVIGSSDNKLYALNGTNGNEVWTFTAGDEIYSAPSIGDINDDTYLEVAVGSLDGKMYIVNGTSGAELCNYSTGDDIGTSPALVDFNGDNLLEVVFGSWDNKTYVINGTDCSLIWNYTTGGSIWSSPAIADITGGSIQEVVIGSYDGKIYALNGSLEDLTQTARKLWEYSFANGSATYSKMESSPAIADINNDSTKEVVFGTMISYPSPNYVIAINGDTGNQVWNFSVKSNWILSSPLLFDVNNDTYLEVIVGSHTPDKKLYSLNGTNGLEIWNYTTMGHVDSSPAIADITGDGYYDIVFGSSDNHVYAVNGVDGSLIWNKSVGYYVHSTPAIEDVNGDSELDIIIGTVTGNKVFILDPPGDWSSFGGNPQRTSVIDETPPVADVYGVTSQSPYPNESVTIYSYWRDFSNLYSALIEESALGYYVIHPVGVSRTGSWVNYTIPEQNLQPGEEVGYMIHVTDSYGNTGTVSGGFTVLLEDEEPEEEVKKKT